MLKDKLNRNIIVPLVGLSMFVGGVVGMAGIAGAQNVATTNKTAAATVAPGASSAAIGTAMEMPVRQRPKK